MDINITTIPTSRKMTRLFQTFKRYLLRLDVYVGVCWLLTLPRSKPFEKDTSPLFPFPISLPVSHPDHTLQSTVRGHQIKFIHHIRPSYNYSPFIPTRRTGDGGGVGGHIREEKKKKEKHWTIRRGEEKKKGEEKGEKRKEINPVSPDQHRHLSSCMGGV